MLGCWSTSTRKPASTDLAARVCTVGSAREHKVRSVQISPQAQPRLRVTVDNADRTIKVMGPAVSLTFCVCVFATLIDSVLGQRHFAGSGSAWRRDRVQSGQHSVRFDWFPVREPYLPCRLSLCEGVLVNDSSHATHCVHVRGNALSRKTFEWFLFCLPLKQ